MPPGINNLISCNNEYHWASTVKCMEIIWKTSKCYKYMEEYITEDCKENNCTL